MTLHEVALATYPIGIVCHHCMHHALVTADHAKAQHGDMRTLEEAGLYCGKCGARDFEAVRFEKRSRVHAFMRNV